MESIEIRGRRFFARSGEFVLLPQIVTASAAGLLKPNDYVGTKNLGFVGDAESAGAIMRMGFDAKSWPALRQEWNGLAASAITHPRGALYGEWFVDVVLGGAIRDSGLRLGGSSYACPGVMWASVGAILRSLMPGLLAGDRANGFAMDCLAAIHGGYAPLGWLGGSWPDGYLAVGCPHGPGALPKHLLVDERQVMADARGVGCKKSGSISAVRTERISHESTPNNGPVSARTSAVERRRHPSLR
jgi:hypothetical protein